MSDYTSIYHIRSIARMTYPEYKLHKFHLCVYYSYLINNILRQARSQAGSEQRKKNHFSADFSSTNILSIVHL